jgi:hypothetical protein
MISVWYYIYTINKILHFPAEYIHAFCIIFSKESNNFPKTQLTDWSF